MAAACVKVAPTFGEGDAMDKVLWLKRTKVWEWASVHGAGAADREISRAESRRE